MLNTDMALVLDGANLTACTEYVPPGQISNVVKPCKNNDERIKIVEKFVEKPGEWQKVFFSAMKKLQENGVKSTLAKPGFNTDGSVCKPNAADVSEKEKVTAKACWDVVCGDGYECEPLTDKDYLCQVEKDTKPKYQCQDSPGWTNNHGLVCGDYAREACGDGAITAGFEWMATHDYNSPGYHCCVCGRGKGGCQDTPGWTNGHGVKCSGMKEFCADGDFKKGFEWMGKTKNGAKENNHPGYHCCACGKKTAEEECVNTPQWSNNHGLTCGNYEAEACSDGGFEKAFEWMGGTKESEADYNYPTHNCCVCGKHKGDGGAMQPTSGTMRPPTLTTGALSLIALVLLQSL